MRSLIQQTLGFSEAGGVVVIDWFLQTLGLSEAGQLAPDAGHAASERPNVCSYASRATCGASERPNV